MYLLAVWVRSACGRDHRMVVQFSPVSGTIAQQNRTHKYRYNTDSETYLLLVSGIFNSSVHKMLGSKESTSPPASLWNYRRMTTSDTLHFISKQVSKTLPKTIERGCFVRSTTTSVFAVLCSSSSSFLSHAINLVPFLIYLQHFTCGNSCFCRAKQSGFRINANLQISQAQSLGPHVASNECANTGYVCGRYHVPAAQQSSFWGAGSRR